MTLGDNQTVIKIDEVVKLNLGFKYDDGKREQRGQITMCVLDMPGKSIIVGLPDIIESYYYVFIDMIEEAKKKTEQLKLNMVYYII